MQYRNLSVHVRVIPVTIDRLDTTTSQDKYCYLVFYEIRVLGYNVTLYIFLFK